MKFDYNKEYVATELIDIFELPLYVRKGTWTSDFCFKILSVGESLYGETYKGGSLYQSNKKYRTGDRFYVCEESTPIFKVVESASESDLIVSDDFDVEFLDLTFSVGQGDSSMHSDFDESAVDNNDNEEIISAKSKEQFIDDEQVYEEENANLVQIENQIDVLYDKEWKRYLEYKEEIESFVVYDWEDRNRLLDIREIAEPCKRLAEEYLSFKPSPYFMRVDVDMNEKGIKTYFIGKKGLAEGINTIVYDWYNPIAYNARFTRNKKFKVASNNCTLYLRRQINIEDQKITYINTEFDSNIILIDGKVIDPFLLSVLRDKRRDYKLTDIIKTIQLNQSEIISKPINESFIVQGCAGSGKTMILLHRLSYLLHNYDNYGVEKYCILTPNEFFNLHIDDLSKDLGIDQISRFTVEQYYKELIERLTVDDFDSRLNGTKVTKVAKIKMPTGALTSEKLLDEQFLKEVYSDAFQAELKKIYGDIWDSFRASFREKSFSRLTEESKMEIPDISDDNFETYKKLKSYHANLKALATKIQKDMDAANKKRFRAVELLLDHERKIEDLLATVATLERDIKSKTSSMLTRIEKESEQLKQDEDAVNSEIEKLEADRTSATKELRNSFTAQEEAMSDMELIAVTYVANAETPLATYMKGVCGQEIADVEKLRLEYKNIPSYNFGKKVVVTQKIEEKLQQYQKKAIVLLGEYKDRMQSDMSSLTLRLQQIEEGLSACNMRREDIQAQQKQNDLHRSKIKGAELALMKENRIALLEPLPNDLTLEFIKDDLGKLVQFLKKIEESQKIVSSQKKEKKDNEKIIEECKKYNIDESFQAELADFWATLAPVDMKNIYDVLEEKIKQTYSKYGQKYRKNDNYRHKLYILLMICGFYYGSLRKVEKFINIDEAQDIAVTEYRVLMHILGQDCVLNLYGDVNQLVYAYKGVTGWNELDSRISSNLYFLNENYRNTIQITEYCNNEFGAEVVAIGLNGDEVDLLSLKDAIVEMQNKHKANPNSRKAIIYKKGNEQIAAEVAEMLSEAECAMDTVDNNKISIITVEMSKGLEFEHVVVITDGMTVNEKYISYTRALESLIVT